MMPAYTSLITGIALILAAVFMLTRIFLLDPVMTHYPKAPTWLRNSMFMFAAVLMFVGLHFLWVFASGKPDTYPPQPSPYMQLIALALCIDKGVMLANLLRQRLPTEIWERLNRVNERLHCKDGKPIWSWLSR
jgi:hypothetical protein